MAEVPWYLVLDDIGKRSEALKRKKTNADRFRSASDEELADELLDLFAAFMEVEWSGEMILDWLRQEAEEGEE